MSRYRVVVRVNGVRPAIQATADEQVVDLAMDSGSGGNNVRLQAWDALDRMRVGLTPNAATDFVRLAAAVYSADLLIPRKLAPDGWTRDIVLDLPVTNQSLWVPLKGDVEKLLRFLTGDVWSFNPLGGGASRPPVNPRLRRTINRVDPAEVCLFSGGLDSFLGAVDLLGQGKKLYLVSHRSTGGASFANNAQTQLVRRLEANFPQDRISHLPIHVTPPRPGTFRHMQGAVGAEPTTRSRSLIFIGLGVGIASSVGASKLYVPENGFITINPALTRARIGSHSTRTTHPETFRLINELLSSLQLGLQVENPYRFQTKGEMLRAQGATAWVPSAALTTLSCGKLNAARIMAGKSGSTGARKGMQCGACVPCIIRRGAFDAAGIQEPPGTYVLPADEALITQRLSSGTAWANDVRAFKVAKSRIGSFGPAETIGSGPLPGPEVADFISVVQRGLAEAAKVIR